MTDLENLWNDLSTGTPPVDAIVREGRASVARRRMITRPLIAVAMTAVVIGAFVVGVAVGDGRAPGTGLPQGEPSPVAFQADLKPAQSCGQLLASYRDRGLNLVGPWGWEPAFVPLVGRLGSPLALGNLGFRQYSAVPSTAKRSQTASDTGTNVQERGVDEPDTVKTDGELVVRLRGNDLVIYDASGADMVKQSTIDLPRFAEGEILLAGATVVAIGEDQVSPRDPATGMRGSRVITVSLADPEEPTIESTVTYSSGLLSARQHGTTVRLVLAEGLPELDFIQPEGSTLTEQQALAHNRRIVQESTIDDWLPSYDAGEGAEQLIDCTDVAIPPDTLGLDTVSVVGFTASTPTELHAIGLAGAATIAYESADHLYLADGPAGWGCPQCLGDKLVGPIQGSGGTTHLYDFKLDGVNAIHVASGEVEGTIADRWSLDEADGVLRVAVEPSSETGNFSSIVTLQREGERLVEIGRLDGLGKNEDLKSVRWFDDLAIVVTYREVDPLYTIDLSDPTNLRLIGKLKVSGFSAYLHPLNDDQLLGIGYGGANSRAAQIALFDITDLADVKRTDVETYPRTEAIATWEPRAFTWLPERDAVLTVVQKGPVVKIATLLVDGGQLSSALTKVEYGSDAAQVRTIGMPDGRVVLVTGEDVRFFDMP